jgi:hypothetical protein
MRAVADRAWLLLPCPPPLPRHQQAGAAVHTALAEDNYATVRGSDCALTAQQTAACSQLWARLVARAPSFC